MAAAAAGAEAADGSSRNCGTAAVVSTASAIWQGGGAHTHWLGELKTTDSRFLFLETYSQETPPVAAAAAQQLHTQQKTLFNEKVKNVSCEYDRLNG